MPVTFNNFAEYGVERHRIRPAITELVALGFVRITQHGQAGNADFRIPNKFRLTHLPANDGVEPATNEWRRIKTVEEAENIAKLARLVGEGLEPISKSSEEDNEAGELDKAEEVLSVVLPADEYATLPLYPGEEALDEQRRL